MSTPAQNYIDWTNGCNTLLSIIDNRALLDLCEEYMCEAVHGYGTEIRENTWTLDDCWTDMMRYVCTIKRLDS